MLRRIDVDDTPRSLLASLGLAPSEPVVTASSEAERETSLLPHDHPKWATDALTVSARAKELFARLKPVIVRVLSFWDHRLRSITIGDHRIHIDPSGSYRVD